jgi:hypothetical protein
MLLDIMSAVAYLTRGSKDFFLSVLKAHMDLFRNLPALLGERRNTKNLTGFGHAGKVYKGSIVLDYFILRKRKFSQINP